MKVVQSLILAALVAVPAVSFAQSQTQSQPPVTRAEVRAELVQLQKAGYSPASDNTQYPQNIQAAEARISAGNDMAASAYGGVSKAASASGSHAPMNHAAANGADIAGAGSIYAHS